MPYRTKWEAPEVFLTHKGVTVWHVYRNNDMGDGARTPWFSLAEEEGDGDGPPFEFDEREVHLPEDWDDTGVITIEDGIKAAIEAGILTNEEGFKQ